MTKLYSAACERNAEPILQVLAKVLPSAASVLEIGSGTGQHAVYFGARLPGVLWQTSDLPDTHDSILTWKEEAGLSNVLPPLVLDMRRPQWPDRSYDAVYTANTLHIMGWQEVETLFAGVPAILRPDGVLCVYGPFNLGGRYTSEGNRQFDAALRSRSPGQGIRDLEAVDELARGAGLELAFDVTMPANNRLIVWRRLPD